ncbi:type III polyketide synthase [uncultured Arsenicicoccus sp.]|uniref:type III polyketide synthase n=1 Tax=uncultured Arsenicicoccus sp. TaxID=491339 RepID=UPI00259A8333|nr:3-oxoacyl-[acyl-carrier-protein] synthase III C-terminal domain-containing protein [uncultured Arsenicicoccus sp.]
MVAVRGVLPTHTYPQHEITDAVAEFTGAASGPRRRMLDQVHANAGVRTRHLAMPLERYARLADFGEANDVFIEAAVELGCQAVEAALADAGLAPRDVDLLVSATVTGLAVPSIDARIVARLRMRSDVRRVPLVGLGCVAGAAGIARVHDHLVGHPDHVAVLVAAEMCSLTVQRDDTTPANMVASGLFGDGAAAVVMVGADRRPPGAAPADPSPRPQVLDTRSRFYDDTERAMGWDVGATGLRIVLGVEVPELVRSHVREDVDGFLALHDLTRDDIGWWVAHPGGPKVLEAMQEALEVPRDALGVTWDSLAAIGNLSSASVLHVLADTLRTRPPRPGSLGMLLAMGPGFCLEMVLLRAPEDAR